MKKSKLRKIVRDIIFEQAKKESPINVVGDFYDSKPTMPSPINEQGGGTIGCTIPQALNYDINATGCCPTTNPLCGPDYNNSTSYPLDSWPVNWCCDFGVQYLHRWGMQPLGPSGNICGDPYGSNDGTCDSPFWQTHMFMDYYGIVNNTYSPPGTMPFPPYNNPAIANTINSDLYYQHTGAPSIGDIIGQCDSIGGMEVDRCMVYMGLDAVPWPYNGGFHYFTSTPYIHTNYGSDCPACARNSFNAVHCPGCAGLGGCTDPTALNYDPNATTDDGSCTYDVFGCTDSTANNYDPNATVDDGSCIYPCQTYGCTDPAAINYNSTVAPNCDQGCVYQSDFGCTDPTANNYDSNATVDDGSCIYGPIDPCDKTNWINHINNNYPQLASDPIPFAHFCEYCNDGTIPPMTDSFCKCCPQDPVEPCKPPQGGCVSPLTWNQAACKCMEGPGGISEEILRLQKLANISKK